MSRFFSRPYVVLFIYILIGFGIYFNALNNPFELDDGHIIEENTGIRNLGNIPRFFIDPTLSTSEPANAGHYRPLVTIAYAVSYASSKLNPVGYHIVSLLFHIGTAFLVFLIVKAVLGSTSEVRSKKQEVREQIPPGPPLLKGGWGDSGLLAGFAAGLIFLVHPFNSEAVNYATALSSVMSGCFYLLGFWAWMKFRSKKQEARNEQQEARSQQQEARSKKSEVRENLTSDFLPLDSYLLPLTSYFYIGSLLAFVAGMLSKEVVITLPVMLLLYDLYFNGLRRRLFSLRAYFIYVPFAVITIIYLYIRELLCGGAMPSFQRDIFTQIITILPGVVKYWLMFFWPGGLSLAHHTVIQKMVTLPVILSAIVMLIYIATAILLAWSKKPVQRQVSYFMIWFLVVLLPIIIIPLNQIFQENRGYLAIVSFVSIAGITTGSMFRRGVGTSAYRYVLTAGMVILLGVYSLATFNRNSVWGDSIRFWKDAVEKAPDYAPAYTGLADAYNAQKDYYLVMEAASKGIEANPDDFHLRVLLALANTHIGNTEEAISQYEKALKINDGQTYVWMNLALLYKQTGEFDKAVQCIRNAITRRENFPPFYYHLGRVYSASGNPANAVDAFQKAITLYPDYLLAMHNLAEELEKMGQTAEAVRQYEKIVKHGSAMPHSSELLFEQDAETIRKIVDDSRKRIGG